MLAQGFERRHSRRMIDDDTHLTCFRMCLMRPLLALAKCSGTAPFLLLRPPYCLENSPTPMFCLMYTFLASDAACKIPYFEVGRESDKKLADRTKSCNQHETLCLISSELPRAPRALLSLIVKTDTVSGKVQKRSANFED